MHSCIMYWKSELLSLVSLINDGAVHDDVLSSVRLGA